MPKRRNKKQSRLQGEGFFDTIASWGRTLRDYPKLIAEGPVAAPPGSESSSDLPDKSILKDIADNSYKGTSDAMIDIPGYTLKLKTPTLVIYQKDGANVMVIGVRGTADFRDFRAWFSTAFNVIPDSQRFKEDLAEITNFQQQYPLNIYTYYATGHSLGGTLIDELIKKGMVKEARTYNPAIETDDIPNVALSQKNHRIYADGDPLYLLQGRYDNPAEVRKSYKYYPSSVMDFVPGYDKYKQHVLANPVFVGGEVPEYEKLKWGSFTKQFQAYLRKNPNSEIKDLKDFAQMVVANPDKFAKTTEKRARFYLNVILKGKGEMKNVIMKPADYYQEHRNIVGLLDKTGKALQREAQDQKAEATKMAKSLGHSNPFFHLRGLGPSKKQKDPTYNWEYDPYDYSVELDLPRRDPDYVDRIERQKIEEEGLDEDIMDPQRPVAHREEHLKGKRSQKHHQLSPNYDMPARERRELIPYLWEGVTEPQMRAAMKNPEVRMPHRLAYNMGQIHYLDQERKRMEKELGRPLTEDEWYELRSSKKHEGSAPSFSRKRFRDQYDTPQGRGIMANSQFYRTDPKRLGGRGLLDDFKKGIEKVTGKLPERAVLSPEQEADVKRRQHIQDVDKQRAKMVASKKQIAIDDMMGNAQYPNVLKAIYAREGTDNPKDYLARVVEKATKRAEEFYPY